MCFSYYSFPFLYFSSYQIFFYIFSLFQKKKIRKKILFFLFSLYLFWCFFFIHAIKFPFFNTRSVIIFVLNSIWNVTSTMYRHYKFSLHLRIHIYILKPNTLFQMCILQYKNGWTKKLERQKKKEYGEIKLRTL